MNKRRFLRKVRKLAASCDPSTPEREYAVVMYYWLRSRLDDQPASMTPDPELVARDRPDQEEEPAAVTSLQQAQSIFNTLFAEALSE